MICSLNSVRDFLLVFIADDRREWQHLMTNIQIGRWANMLQSTCVKFPLCKHFKKKINKWIVDFLDISIMFWVPMMFFEAAVQLLTNYTQPTYLFLFHLYYTFDLERKTSNIHSLVASRNICIEWKCISKTNRANSENTNNREQKRNKS